ncbi:MAG: carbonic anhydrase [Leptolyngbyaceae cyanobacterium]
MERRALLKLLAASSVSTIASMAFVPARQTIAKAATIDWNYTGTDGPDNWGNLSAAYQACQTGQQQSPIDLEGAIASPHSDLDIVYRPMPLTIQNTGHTIQVTAAPGNWVAVDGEPFELQQFHFHTPSEHILEHMAYAMEMHLVHQNADGELLVLGVFLAEGAENPDLRSLWAAMPPHKSAPRTIPEVKIDLLQLLPRDCRYYFYKGSLTTPPCSERVRWIVLQQSIGVSPAQVAQFQRLFLANARPVQPRNQRSVFESD